MGPFKSNDTGVFGCLVTMRAAPRKRWEESSGETCEAVSGPQPGTAAEVQYNVGQKILRCIQDGVGAAQAPSFWSNLLKSLLPEH